MVEWVARVMRAAATPSTGRRFSEMNALMDVCEVLPLIRVPTLVLERAESILPKGGTDAPPGEEGRYVAEQIPGAKLVILPGRDYFPWVGDQHALAAEVAEFVAGARYEQEPERVLVTVLFTDIAESTKRAAEVGDSRWRSLLSEHNADVRRALQRFRGTEVDRAGDGFLATFDGPARAIRCAQSLVADLRELGLDIRAGLHTGEVELVEHGIGGIGVHIGARVLAKARAGEVLVTRTVRDLVAGSGDRVRRSRVAHAARSPRALAAVRGHGRRALGVEDREPKTPLRRSSGTKVRIPQRPTILAASVIALAALATATASGSADRSSAKLHGNNFFSNCRFSHTGNDDPIVHPRHPGGSHHHTFFGNTSTDAYSSLASLRAAGTTCRPRADKAAYWVPTLFQNGREVRPAKGQFYYVMRGLAQMRPFPAGLRIVAGDAHARRAQPVNVAWWACGGRGGVRTAPSTTAPTCGIVDAHYTVITKKCPSCRPTRMNVHERVRTFLELHVNFPDCWDGTRLDSADHHSHMAYSRAYVCPPSHPVKVPLIRMMIRYPIAGGAGVMLASGGQLTGHADFFNAWDARVLAKLVHDCFHDRPCNER